MTAVTEIEAFEAGRTHEVSQFARRVGTGVEFPAVPWAESMNVGAVVAAFARARGVHG
jgi:hypothetical protein